MSAKSAHLSTFGTETEAEIRSNSVKNCVSLKLFLDKRAENQCWFEFICYCLLNIQIDVIWAMVIVVLCFVCIFIGAGTDFLID